MKLFKKRNSNQAPQLVRLSFLGHDPQEYQTVKAMPAVVVEDSPSKTKHVFSTWGRKMGKKLENLKRSDSKESTPSTSSGAGLFFHKKEKISSNGHRSPSSTSTQFRTSNATTPGIYRSASTSHLYSSHVHHNPQAVDSHQKSTKPNENIEIDVGLGNKTYSCEDINVTTSTTVTKLNSNQPRRTNFPYAFLRSRLGPVPEVEELHGSRQTEKDLHTRLNASGEKSNGMSQRPHARSASFSVSGNNNGVSISFPEDDSTTTTTTAGDNYMYINYIRSDESGYESDGTRTGTNSPHDTPRKERLKSNGSSTSSNIFNYDVFNDVSYVKFEEPDYENEYNRNTCNNYESWTLDRKFRKDRARQRELRAASMYHQDIYCNSLQDDAVFIDNANHETIPWNNYNDHHLNARQTLSCWDIVGVGGGDDDDDYERQRMIDPLLVPFNDGVDSGSNKSFVLIRLQKDCSGELGIYITSQTDEHTGTRGYVIAHIENGGLAEKNGRLLVGDELVNVNGKRLRGLTLEEARNTLKSTPKDVAIVVLRTLNQEIPSENLSQKMDDNKVISWNENQTRTNRLMSLPSFETEEPSSSGMRLEKIPESGLCTLPRRPKSSMLTIHTAVFEKGIGKKSLGFSIVGGRDSPKGQMGIYVKSVFPTGQAAINDSLQQGDEIFTVNGIAMQGLSHAEAIAVFKLIKQGQVILHVGRRTPFVKKATPMSKSCNDLEKLE